MKYKLLIVASILTAACGGYVAPPQPPTGPTPVSDLDAVLRLISTFCPSNPNPVATAMRCVGYTRQPSRMLDCICGGGIVPTATATSAPTAAVTATPVLTPSQVPSPRFLPTVPSTCVPGAPSLYVDKVRRSMLAYQTAHPEQFEGAFFKYPLSQDVFLNGIIDGLRIYNLDGMIDPCMCGDLVVADHTTPLGSGFAEGYHPISGQERLVQAQPYKERCTPRWLAYETRVVPTAGPPPEATPMPTIPPIVTMLPPTLDFFNGCREVHVDGKCEFAQWWKVEIPPGRPQPLCSRDQCPSFWRPSGMALTSDHMFTDPGAAGGIFEPRAGRWVSVMWYVSGGRKWDDPRGPVLTTTGSVQCSHPGWKRGGGFDMFNATCSGFGTVTVCARADAFACADPSDYSDRHDETYGADVGQTPHCQHGTVPLPGAGSCRGPFEVNR